MSPEGHREGLVAVRLVHRAVCLKLRNSEHQEALALLRAVPAGFCFCCAYCSNALRAADPQPRSTAMLLSTFKTFIALRACRFLLFRKRLRIITLGLSGVVGILRAKGKALLRACECEARYIKRADEIAGQTDTHTRQNIPVADTFAIRSAESHHAAHANYLRMGRCLRWLPPERGLDFLPSICQCFPRFPFHRYVEFNIADEPRKLETHAHLTRKYLSHPSQVENLRRSNAECPSPAAVRRILQQHRPCSNFWFLLVCS